MQLKKQKTADPTLKRLMIGILGTIATKIKGEMLLTTGLLAVKAAARYARQVCYCGVACEDQHASLDCMACQRVFHSDCVGAPAGDSQVVWYCEACQQVPCQTEKGSLLTEADAQRELHVRQNLLLQYMLLASKQDAAVRSAMYFSVGQWLCKTLPNDQAINTSVDDASAQETRALALESRHNYLLRAVGLVSTRAAVPAIQEHVKEALTSEMAQAIAQDLGRERALYKGYDRLLQQVLAALNDNDGQTRQRALKALSSVASVDSSMLHQPLVKQWMEQLCRDQQILVREAAVGLLGTFVLTDPMLVQDYVETMLARLRVGLWGLIV